MSAAVAAVRGPARRAFYRSQTLRGVIAAARRPKLRRDLPDLAHLTFFKETADGPVQRDEALFLHAVLRVVRPGTVVEIGFLRGHSAFNFLRALDPEGRLYSFDIDPACEKRAQELCGHDARFVFRTRSQDALTREDIDGRLADFVFLDASHDLTLNQATLERLLPLMSPDAILAIHDTGTVPRALVPSRHWLGSPEGWVGNEREVVPDERAFVNWLLDQHPEFAQIHFHSSRTLRCGITLVQRATSLARSDSSPGSAEVPQSPAGSGGPSDESGYDRRP
jgi:predicted O-methyltransferase YrrM